MMRNIYVFYDHTAQESGAPRCIKNDGLALRWFEHEMKEIPEKNEFSLVCIGKYDNESCVLFPETEREVIPTVNTETETE